MNNGVKQKLKEHIFRVFENEKEKKSKKTNKQTNKQMKAKQAKQANIQKSAQLLSQLIQLSGDMVGTVSSDKCDLAIFSSFSLLKIGGRQLIKNSYHRDNYQIVTNFH